MSEINVSQGTVEKMLEESGSYASVTSGVSMRPLFRTHRDVVILESPPEHLKKYDVALYRINGKYILHRVIGIDEEKKVYIIRGDNTFHKEYIPFDKIIAVLKAFNRKGKHHSVEEKGYVFYARFWNFIFPIRCLVRAPLTLYSRLKNRFFAPQK